MSGNSEIISYVWLPQNAETPTKIRLGIVKRYQRYGIVDLNNFNGHLGMNYT